MDCDSAEMTEYHLIVSNPPHRTIQAQAAAQCFQCTAAEVRMKANFPAPEIWLAETDAGAVRQWGKALLGAGLNVALVRGSVLAAVPRIQWAGAVRLGESGFTVITETGEVEIARDDRVVAVFGEPHKQEARSKTGSGSILTQQLSGRSTGKGLPIAPHAAGVGGVVAQAAMDQLGKVAKEAKESAKQRLSDIDAGPEPSMFLDLYVYAADGWRAVRLTPAGVDFSGLGDLMKPTARANIQTILETLENAHLDERLMHVTYRFSVVGGTALNKVLGEIAEDLGAIPPMDLGSSLVFLTSMGRAGEGSVRSEG